MEESKSKQTYPTLQSFIQKTRKLLQQQQQEQKLLFEEMTQHKSYQEIEEEGCGLSSMVVLSCRDGLYDKIIISMKKSYHSEKNPVTIPDHCKLQVGDDVAIYYNNSVIAEGIVYKRTNEKIKVAVNSEPQENQDFDGFKVNLVLKWNQVTYRRYNSVLDALQNVENHNELVEVLFKESARGYKPKEPIQFSNKRLNEQQNLAIGNGLSQLCHLVHGPPGTGKTTTICHLIAEAAQRGQKILACAPSNIAVDNIVQGISSRASCVRIGNPTRIIPEVLNQCLDFLVDRQEGNWKTQEKRLNAAQKKVKRAHNKAERKEIYKEIKDIRKQIKTLQQQVIMEVLEDADVVCCTNAGAADRVFKRYLNKRVFDLVVIDQCGQGLQVSCWIPLLKGKRAVLAGDHKQLPPTVKFQQDSLLSYTLFTRAMEQLKYITSTMLQVQYRMNKHIMGWSNKMFYDQRLKAHESVENHKLKEIYEGVDEENSIIMFLDTAGCHIGEEGGEMQSKMNVGEGDIICHLTKKIMGYGVRPKDIAILTPYSKQVTQIKNILNQHISQNLNNIPEVSTVDGIQGREKQCILISLVRSNPKGQVGFLKDWRRMNVAVTRARRMLIIVGDSDTVGADKKIASLIQWVSQNGSVQSAEQLRDEEQIRFGIGKSSIESIKKQQRQHNNEQRSKKQKKKKKQKQTTKPTQTKSNVPKLHTQEEKQDKANEYRAILDNLNGEIEFKDLTAYERMVVHQVATQLDLQHFTSEDKTKLTVRVKTDEPITEPEKKQDHLKKNKKKKKQKPTQELKDIQDSDSSEQPQRKPIKIVVPEPKTEQNETTNKKKNKNKKKKQQKKEEDIDKLLLEFQNDLPKKDQCYKCKKKITSVTSAECRFCHYYFCRHDLLAEEHGCQQAARNHAKKGNMDRFIEQGSKKIQQKLREQQQQRQRKQKEDKKKK